MSDFEKSIIQVGSSYVHNNVYTDFINMSNELYSQKDIRINIEESFIPEYVLVDQLRRLVKYKNSTKNQKYSQYFDITIDINVLRADSEKFNNFITHLESLSPDEFEPPLISTPSNSDIITSLYSIPNKLSLDPRRSGAIIKLGPSQVIHDVTLRWLKKNALDYGFVFYGPFDKSIWMYNKTLISGFPIFNTVDSLSTLLSYLDHAY